MGAWYRGSKKFATSPGRHGGRFENGAIFRFLELLGADLAHLGHATTKTEHPELIVEHPLSHPILPSHPPKPPCPPGEVAKFLLPEYLPNPKNDPNIACLGHLKTI